MPALNRKSAFAVVALVILSACTSDLTVTSPASERMSPLDAPSAAQSQSSATTIRWSGYTWTVTNGAMAGGNTASASNVFVDSDGRLHLKIVKSGSKWTTAELFTNDKLGFGTYQWQIEGRLDKLNKNVVLGLFPYGPKAGLGKDGENEIDIEFSQFGSIFKDPGNWTIYSASGKKKTHSFDFSLSGTYTTSRFNWSSSEIAFSLFGGFQKSSSNSNSLKSWKYAPSKPADYIPQKALPLGMNLWLYESKPPTDGKNVEIIIHSFTKS